MWEEPIELTGLVCVACEAQDVREREGFCSLQTLKQSFSFLHSHYCLHASEL